MIEDLFGIIPPMVTPFDDREELDAAALAADVEYLIEGAGVHGLAVGGSTGEGHTLTDEELRTAVRDGRRGRGGPRTRHRRGHCGQHAAGLQSRASCWRIWTWPPCKLRRCTICSSRPTTCTSATLPRWPRSWISRS